MTPGELISLLDNRQEFVTGDDGFVIFWPMDCRTGGYTASVLRTIADELDKRNADWARQVERNQNDRR